MKKKKPAKKKAKGKKAAKPKKKPARRPAKKRARRSAPAGAKKEKPIGVVTHYFGKIKVAVAKFKGKAAVGDAIRIRGATTDFTMKIASLQRNHEAVKTAPKGKEVGMKVPKRVRTGDMLYRAS